MEYDKGNYNKYMTANPLKRAMVCRLNKKIIRTVGMMVMDKKKMFRILDAGCGEGFISGLVMDHFKNINITGLEYVDEALEVAKQRNSTITFQQGDICQMPFADKAFDIVICTEVLEHLEHPECALKEITRVSERTVLLTVPNEPWFCLGNLLVLKNVKSFGNPAGHINHWTFHAFVKYVNKKVNRENWVVETQRSFPWTVVILKRKQSI